MRKLIRKLLYKTADKLAPKTCGDCKWFSCYCNGQLKDNVDGCLLYNNTTEVNRNSTWARKCKDFKPARYKWK